MTGRGPHDVLVLSSYKPLPARLLASELVGRVSVITEPPFAHCYGPGVRVRTVPSVDDLTAVCQAALAVFADGPVDAVLAPAEAGIAASGLLRSHYGVQGIGYQTANACSNKYAMKRALAAAGVPVAAFRPVYRLAEVPRAAAELGWPVVVKPSFGGGAFNVVELRSPHAFEAFAAGPGSAGLRAQRTPLLVESLVEMTAEYHCDAVVHEGEPLFAAVSRYHGPVLRTVGALNGSYPLPETHPDRPAALALLREVLAAVGLRSGVAHVELLRTETGLLVGEIACRPPGGGLVEGLALQYGVDLWQAFLETSLGLPPTLRPRRARRIVANSMLPAKPGRITAITPAEQLAALPGVLRVTMTRRVGDVVDADVYSTSSTGVVLFAVDREEQVPERLRDLARLYRLDVAPTEAATEAPADVSPADVSPVDVSPVDVSPAGADTGDSVSGR
ncbi:ATP-grasp domain-containing protein [Streptacidiphilus sp. P02-A3a]|uniref:ATP-grasp domain-containing protein n=1 Tax=Streptacidiphilus sp. P02-A3a TaxID=2704468 RepID=UPI0015F9D21E|nr:ATP-grasp domain-containing protein [Streptacidiphilus sp. P02-A3a]QMU70505.1 ATP-grasp domain-containing protein [Streptacidiphilus sp. P02-A3a]